jgi:hypothetical protein
MFDDQAEAQEAFDKDPVGLSELDADNDGIVCELETTPAGNPGTGGLPLTGPSIVALGTGAALLIGIGVVLLILVRRRKAGFEV